MEFAGARIRLEAEEEKQEALRGRKAAYEEEGRRLRGDRLHVQDILDNQEAILRMEEYLLLQQSEVEKAEQELEEKRVLLQEAMQERKTYERLREKAFEEFRKEENARESKEIDELTSYVHGRTRRVSEG